MYCIYARSTYAKYVHLELWMSDVLLRTLRCASMFMWALLIPQKIMNYEKLLIQNFLKKSVHSIETRKELENQPLEHLQLHHFTRKQ